MSTEILSQLGVGIIIIDLTGRIRYVNNALENIFPMPSKSLLGMNFYDNSLPWVSGLAEGEEKVFPIIQAKTTGEPIAKNIEYKINNNSIKIVNFASPLRNKKGGVIGAINIFFNATQIDKLDEAKHKVYFSLKKFVSNNTLNHILNTIKVNNLPAVTKRFVTIVFIDIVGFSSMAEKLDPHQTVTLLNIFFNKVYKTIVKYKGDIDKYLGDAILATFFEAESAVRCFTEILLVELPIINAQVKKVLPDIPDIAVHIGINSGWVILGEVGANERKELTVIGDDVNTAARIQALTPPNEIWISGRTVANLGDFTNLLKEADYIKVKGKTLRIKVYKFDPTAIKLTNKVFYYEKNEQNQKNIRELLERKGITTYTHADSIEKVDKLLTKDYDSLLVGPDTSAKEFLSIQQILERVGLSNDIIIPISKDVDPKSIEILERYGIQTYIPQSEGKQFDANLENVLRTQRIKRIPSKVSSEEVKSKSNAMYSSSVNNPIEAALKEKEFNSNFPDNKKNSLSDSIIYKKHEERMEITVMKILSLSQIDLLSDNLLKFWEYDYRSNPAINFVIKFDDVIHGLVEEEYIVSILGAIFQMGKMSSKGWNKGFLIFQSKDAKVKDMVEHYKEDYRVKFELTP